MIRPLHPKPINNEEKEKKDLLVGDIDEYLQPSTRKLYSNLGIPY